MSITIIPIHENGAHQRSLQVSTVNQAYVEIRRHADKQEKGKPLNSNVMFAATDSNPITKFVIINGDAVEVIAVIGFNRLRV